MRLGLLMILWGDLPNQSCRDWLCVVGSCRDSGKIPTLSIRFQFETGIMVTTWILFQIARYQRLCDRRILSRFFPLCPSLSSFLPALQFQFLTGSRINPIKWSILVRFKDCDAAARHDLAVSWQRRRNWTGAVGAFLEVLWQSPNDPAAVRLSECFSRRCFLLFWLAPQKTTLALKTKTRSNKTMFRPVDEAQQQQQQQQQQQKKK